MKRINPEVLTSNVQWFTDPFPYAIIDNFLPDNYFTSLCNSLTDARPKISLQKNFQTDSENKDVFTDEQLPADALELISFMGGQSVKQYLANRLFMPSKNIISMLETPGYSGLSPFHISKKEGFLGSHVDHSILPHTDLIHFANSIFYCSSDWHPSWGGETVLFSSFGMREKALVEPRPNRLLIFIHSSSSFHGANKYYGEIDRRTFYHDYYISRTILPDLIKSVERCFNKSYVHIDHSTTFVPYFPFGLSSFRFKSLFSLRNAEYLYYYLRYIAKRIFLIAMFFSQTPSSRLPKGIAE